MWPDTWDAAEYSTEHRIAPPLESFLVLIQATEKPRRALCFPWGPHGPLQSALWQPPEDMSGARLSLHKAVTGLLASLLEQARPGVPHWSVLQSQENSVVYQVRKLLALDFSSFNLLLFVLKGQYIYFLNWLKSRKYFLWVSKNFPFLLFVLCPHPSKLLIDLQCLPLSIVSWIQRKQAEWWEYIFFPNREILILW